MDNLSIVEQLLYSTVKIIADLGNCKKCGTGFFYQKNGKTYLISNKHIIEAGELSIYLSKPLGNTLKNPEVLELKIGNANLWSINTEYDIAYFQVNSLPQGVFFKTIPDSFGLKKSIEDTLDALEEIVFIGYPNGISDSYNNIPIIRKGSTATPISYNYLGKEEFVIDASVFGGSSGSPVFICNKSGYTDKKGNSFFGSNRIIFLGILRAVHQKTTFGSLEISDIAKITPTHKQEIDLGIVIKNSVIDAFLK